MMEYLNLPIKDKHNLAINKDAFKDIQNELEEFVLENNHTNTRTFAKKVMFSHEIKANNNIEGINDDLLLIEAIIKDAYNIKDEEQRKRIINLYKGYQYILTHRIFDKYHLRELYNILSDGLLCNADLSRMGHFYRTDKVYILKSGRLDMELDQGIDYKMIDYYMNYYFDYINSNNNLDSLTDYFIKSQIMHLYLVFIHPYFDVNGRTSRTMAMWYLLREKAYSFILFNRAITFDSKYYDKEIIAAKEKADASNFLRYMMIDVKKELEKEMVMAEIAHNTHGKLTSIDYQSLMYAISMNDEINVLNFATMYNRFNDKKKIKEIYEECIIPLIDKGILVLDRTTSKNMFDGNRNEVYRFSDKAFDKESPKIRRLNLNNK